MSKMVRMVVYKVDVTTTPSTMEVYNKQVVP